MIRTRFWAVGLTASLLVLGACSKKPEELPPPPPTTAAPQPAETAPPPPPPTGAVTSTTIPGSLADFVEKAGSDRVLFAYDSYELDDAARDTLTRQAAWLSQYGSVRMTIEGHADERGTREYNLALGERRANAVKNFLAGQGIDAGRIAVISYGKERPAVEGSDESAWAQNRRGVTVLSGAAAS